MENRTPVMNSRIFLLLFALGITFCSEAQFYNNEVEASIALEVLDNSILQIVGSAYNKTEINKSLRYDLSIIKGNSSDTNKSKSTQDGHFVLEPGVKKNLATTSINAEEGIRTIILLLIYDEENSIVGKDRKLLNGLEGEEDTVRQEVLQIAESDVQDSKKDGYILRGMVIENTKTKGGSDFYDMFYSSYLARNINGEEIVKIDEKLAIANNTQIQVVVGDNVVMQFIMNPRNQYLEQMADQAIYRVNLYFQQLRNRKNQIIRY